MASLDFNHVPGRSFAFHRVHAAVSNTMASFATWNDARKTHNTLSRLSAHELEDIGLIPGDVDALGRKGTF
ncbi:MAG: DUF1127 domain-containing protein [Boseongicola sp.]|nr:MAG: DUF1127 domain-containing protein [Boseongicola sp.]